MSLLDSFGKLEDCCLPAGTDVQWITFEWSAKDIGFGEFYFFYKDNKLHCSNENMSKKFVKRMLCKMVDEAKFIE